MAYKSSDMFSFYAGSVHQERDEMISLIRTFIENIQSRIRQDSRLPFVLMFPVGHADSY
jgi:hypothetical protein